MNSILGITEPIIGLSPTDGVSDNAFRYITKKYGNPDLMFTEFTNVMGLCIAGFNILQAFEYDESQRPIVAQIYGKEPEYFYHASKIVCALGFDGVDINMGCPAKTVAASGSGAGLIRTPDLAREIIAAVKRGVDDWKNDGKLTGLNSKTEAAVNLMVDSYRKRVINLSDLENKELYGRNNLKLGNRSLIPVSVKTRIGYDIPVTKSWIENLAKESPKWITVHGRTLKQMYTGSADWNEIGIAVDSTNIPIIANGDIKNLEDVKKVLEITKAKGVLIGRGSFGNPWIFKELNTIKDNSYIFKEPDYLEKFKVLIEHTEEFVRNNKESRAFFQMRKHFGWYIKGFDGAKELRDKLLRSNSVDEVKEILKYD